LIVYAGTEYLSLSSVGKVQATFNNGQPLVASASAISANTWYHAVLTFDSTGNTAVPDPNRPGYYTITGNLALNLYNESGTLIDSGVAENVTKNGFGDQLNRPISIGRHPTMDATRFVGLIYNPSVSLGVVPEPSAFVLLTAGMFGLLCYAWRKRK